MKFKRILSAAVAAAIALPIVGGGLNVFEKNGCEITASADSAYAKTLFGDTLTLTNTTYELADDAVLDGYICVPSGVEAIIDLNGYMIDRGLADKDPIDDGFVIKVDGKLTVKDSKGGGKITGGNCTDDAGGVYVSEKGEFTLESGSICGNNARFGGGVFVHYPESKGETGGVFNMTGGSVCKNTANDDAGVSNSGTFNMSGGSVTENNAVPIYVGDHLQKEYGWGSCGGVYNNSNFTMTGGSITNNNADTLCGGLLTISPDAKTYISGNVNISGNKISNIFDSNVVFYKDHSHSNYDYRIIEICGKLDSKARIGITGSPFVSVVTSGLSDKGTIDNFTSDDPSYQLEIKNDEIWKKQVGAVITKAPSVGGFEWIKDEYNEAQYNGDYRRGIIYNGDFQELLSDKGLVSNGTMMYALGTNDTPPADSAFSTKVPTAKFVGDYYIWYKAKGKNGFAGSAVQGPLAVDIRTVDNSMYYYDLYTDVHRCKCGVAPKDQDHPLSEIYSQCGIKAADVVNAEIIKPSDDSNGTVDMSKGTINISKAVVLLVELKNGYKTEVPVYPNEHWESSMKLVLYPDYAGAEPIEMNVTGSVTFPNIKREGYRLLYWANCSTEVDNSGFHTVYKQCFPACSSYISQEGKAGELSLIKFRAVWEPIAENKELTSNIEPSTGDDIYIGGNAYKEIGSGDGKKLYISKNVLDSADVLTDTEKLAAVGTEYVYYTSSGDKKTVSHTNSFDLTLAEVEKYLPNESDRKSDKAWVYKDPERDDSRNFVVDEDGYFTFRSAKSSETIGHRPAFVLDESKVLYVTDAFGGKPSQQGGLYMGKEGDAKKLTLIDEKRNFTASADKNIVNRDKNEKITITYSGGEGTSYSLVCLFLDKNGKIFYSREKSTNAASGTWEIQAPPSTLIDCTPVPAGDYTIWVFSETRNGAYHSDFASKPVIIPFTITKKTTEAMTISGEDSMEYGDTMTLTADKENVTWSSSDSSVAVVDNSGKVTAKSVGTAIIKAQYDSEDSCAAAYKIITVEPRTAELKFENDGKVVYDARNYYAWMPKLIVTNTVGDDKCDAWRSLEKYLIYAMDGITNITNYYHRHKDDKTFTVLNEDLSLSNPNYRLKEGNYELPLEIIPKVLGLEWGETEFTYDGQEHCPTATAKGFTDHAAYRVELVDREAVVEGGKKDVGTYTAAAKEEMTPEFQDNFHKITNYSSNIKWSVDYNELQVLPEDRTTEFTIKPLEAVLEWSGTEVYYDGEEHLPKATVKNLVTGDECEVTVELAGKSSAVNVGTYTAKATALSNGNYALPKNATVTFTIGKKTVTPTVTITGDCSYKNKAITPEYSVKIDNKELYSSEYTATFKNNNKPGTATLTITPSANGNYSFEAVSVNFEIKKAQTLEFKDVKDGVVYKNADDKDTTIDIPATLTGDGTITYKSSDESIATVDDKGTVTIKGVGTAEITATVEGNEQYAKTVAKYTIVVNKAPEKIANNKVTEQTNGADKVYTGTGDAIKWDTPSGNSHIVIGLGDGDDSVTVKNNGEIVLKDGGALTISGATASAADTVIKPAANGTATIDPTADELSTIKITGENSAFTLNGVGEIKLASNQTATISADGKYAKVETTDSKGKVTTSFYEAGTDISVEITDTQTKGGDKIQAVDMSTVDDITSMTNGVSDASSKIGSGDSQGYSIDGYTIKNGIKEKVDSPVFNDPVKFRMTLNNTMKSKGDSLSNYILWYVNNKTGVLDLYEIINHPIDWSWFEFYMDHFSDVILVPSPDYSIDITDSPYGTVTVDKSGNKAKYNEEVTITVTSNSNYNFNSLTVTDENGKAITVKDNKFKMPASNVTIKAVFARNGGSSADYETVNESGVTYHVYSDHAEAVECDTNAESVIINAKVNGVNVTVISENAFNSCTKLKEVKIPEGIKAINANAFWGCTALKTIEISKSVITIEKDAFKKCTLLKEISGYKNSAAEKFAKENNYIFKSIENAATTAASTTAVSGTTTTSTTVSTSSTTASTLGKVNDPKVANDGKITWSKVKNAAEYKVVKVIGDKKFYGSKVAHAFYYFDNIPNEDYKLYVLAYDANGKFTTGKTLTVKVNAVGKASAPTVAKDGTVTWKAVKNAVRYRVVKVVNGISYSGSDVTSTSYKFKSVPVSDYQVYVVAYGENGAKTLGAKASVKADKPLGFVNDAKVSASGKVTWSKAQNAASYRVVKIINGKKFYGKEVKTTSYQFEKSAYKDYQVYVIAYSADKKLTVGKRTTVEVGDLGVVLDTKVDKNGKVSWSAVRGAEKYKVYKVVDGKKYYGITEGTSYTFKNVPTTNYSVYVVAFDKNGKYRVGTTKTIKN